MIEITYYGKSRSQATAHKMAQKKFNELQKRGVNVVDFGTQMFQEIIERPAGYVDFLGQEQEAATISEIDYQAWVTCYVK
jgi:hypothetical protein